MESQSAQSQQSTSKPTKKTYGKRESPQKEDQGDIRPIREQVDEKANNVSSLLSKSLAFTLLKVSERAGSSLAEEIIGIVCDEMYDPSVAGQYVSSLEQCRVAVEDEIKSRNGK